MRHGYLKQMIMKQVEERYISLLTDFGFDRLFEEAEITKFTPQEMREYETSKMAYRDIKNSVDTAKREGLAEGIEIGMNQKAQDIAKNMLAMGLSAEQVARATQLSLEIIKNLSNSKNSSFACKLHTLQVSEHHGIPTCPRHQKSIMSPHALKGAFGPSART